MKYRGLHSSVFFHFLIGELAESTWKPLKNSWTFPGMFRQVSIPIVTGTCLTYDNAYLSECWLTCLGTGVRSSHVRTYLASRGISA